MPRALSTDKFYHYLPTRSGRRKDEILLGINHLYKDQGNITLQDLLEYLEKIAIEPSKVKIPPGYVTTIPV